MAVSDQFVLCKAALVFAVTRYLLSLALNLLSSSMPFLSPNSSPESSSSCCATPSSSSANLKLLRGSLSLTTYGEMRRRRLPEGHRESCAVCLNELRNNSHVWELSNCCHVFHKNCLERWLAYDNRLTCPLCRASLIHARPIPAAPAPAPESASWAVERMLYLFGDDLLP